MNLPFCGSLENSLAVVSILKGINAADIFRFYSRVLSSTFSVVIYSVIVRNMAQFGALSDSGCSCDLSLSLKTTANVWRHTMFIITEKKHILKDVF